MKSVSKLYWHAVQPRLLRNVNHVTEEENLLGKKRPKQRQVQY